MNSSYALKTNEHSENVRHKWVYTLAKGDTEADEELPDTYAEANLSDERFRQGVFQVPSLKSWI